MSTCGVSWADAGPGGPETKNEVGSRAGAAGAEVVSSLWTDASLLTGRMDAADPPDVRKGGGATQGACVGV